MSDHILMTLPDAPMPPEETPIPPEETPIPPEMNLHCLNCGYELTGLTVHRCPECGQPFDPQETYRINQRTKWEYLLTNRCSRTTYPVFLLFKELGVSPLGMERILRSLDIVFYVSLAALVGLFAVLSFKEPVVVVVLVLWIPGEFMIYYFGWGKFLIRFIILICCLLWIAVLFI